MNKEEMNKFYDYKFCENIETTKKILQKDEIDIFDKKLCCLCLRHSIEDICYKMLLFYKDYLTEENLKQYKVNYIMEFIVLFIPFLKNKKSNNNDKIKIGIETSEGNNLFLNYDITDSKKFKECYNKLGEFLHEVELSKLMKNKKGMIEKEELEKIYDYMVKFKNNLILIKSGK